MRLHSLVLSRPGHGNIQLSLHTPPLQVAIHLLSSGHGKGTGLDKAITITITGVKEKNQQLPQHSEDQGDSSQQGPMGGRERVAESWTLPASQLGKAHTEVMVKVRCPQADISAQRIEKGLMLVPLHICWLPVSMTLPRLQAASLRLFLPELPSSFPASFSHWLWPSIENLF